jgi:transcriptional regulator with XRE-family HTH domain
MPKRRRKYKKRTYYCFPAKALLDQFEEGTWASVIAERLGTNRMTIQRWREGTTKFSPYQADKLAIKLGKHPSQIWTDWFDLPEFGGNPPKEQDNDSE